MVTYNLCDCEGSISEQYIPHRHTQSDRHSQTDTHTTHTEIGGNVPEKGVDTDKVDLCGCIMLMHFD